jgi:hypothetical protein
MNNLPREMVDKKRRGPKDHPGPWESQLWDHIEEIRSLRRQRRKWKDIAAELALKGVTISPAAVRNFFIRSRSPKLKLPAGLEHLRPSPESNTAISKTAIVRTPVEKTPGTSQQTKKNVLRKSRPDETAWPQ